MAHKTLVMLKQKDLIRWHPIVNFATDFVIEWCGEGIQNSRQLDCAEY